MNQLPAKLQALAATSRIANVPSVAGNVFLGVALATWLGHPGGESFQTRPGLLVLSGICLYLAGNFLNDWADRHWDAIHRPERALPRRFFTPRGYLAAASLLGLLGLGAAAAVRPQSLIVAGIIGSSILGYTWVHKRTSWSVVPMGLCRALLPVLGFSGFLNLLGSFPALVACAFGVFSHIVGLSLSARRESMAPAPTGLFLRFARLWFPAAAICMFLAAWCGLSLPLAASIAGLIPYSLWIALCLTIHRNPIHAHVSNLLAGIPLVDWIVLLPLAVASIGSGPLSTACMAIPPLAFLSGKALQRLASAT